MYRTLVSVGVLLSLSAVTAAMAATCLLIDIADFNADQPGNSQATRPFAFD